MNNDMDTDMDMDKDTNTDMDTDVDMNIDTGHRHKKTSKSVTPISKLVSKGLYLNCVLANHPYSPAQKRWRPKRRGLVPHSSSPLNTPTHTIGGSNKKELAFL